MIVLGFSPVAEAHHDDPTYYWPGCGNTLAVVTMDTTNWTDLQKDRIKDATLEWNSARNACDPILYFNKSGPSYAWNGCDTAGDIIIQKVGPGTVNGLADTKIWHAGDTGCDPTVSTRRIQQARIRVETPNAEYWGDNIPEPDVNDQGQFGVLVHEMGHAVGFIYNSGNSHWDEDAGHSGYCDSSAAAFQWRTMCSTGYNGYQNWLASLHSDDVQWFNDNYTS